MLLCTVWSAQPRGVCAVQPRVQPVRARAAAAAPTRGQGRHARALCLPRAPKPRAPKPRAPKLVEVRAGHCRASPARTPRLGRLVSLVSGIARPRRAPPPRKKVHGYTGKDY